MSVIGTFNGMNIVALPCDTFPRVVGPSSIEWDEQEVVASDTCTFTGQVLTYDWMASWFEGQVSFPPMTRYSHDAWSAFISECRGPLNCFLLGDPKAKLPKGRNSCRQWRWTDGLQPVHARLDSEHDIRSSVRRSHSDRLSTVQSCRFGKLRWKWERNALDLAAPP
jgi:hypothetical protein